LSLASGVALVIALMVSPAMTTFADDINPGVFAIDSQPYGLSYGRWSEKWWQWAVKQTTFDNCPGESGPVWFLSAPITTPAGSTCVVPANTAILFPTFNVEWSIAEAKLQASQPGTQGTCFVPTNPIGTSYAALLACARVQANNATHAGATLEADVDGAPLQGLTGYRAHSAPPPFTFAAVSGNCCVPAGSSESVADGFWIMLMPLSAGRHTVHFAASVPFPTVNPPATPFTFTADARYCLVVQPTAQTCP
jgi:hypothetical protein